MRRIVFILLGTLIIAGGALWWFQPAFLGRLGLGRAAPNVAEGARQRPQQGAPGGQRPPAPVETARAETGRVADQVEALGTLAANESVSIAPEIAGRITALRFREGETVEADAVLVELDATIARSELEQARANLSLAEDVLNRNQTLVQRGAGTQVALEQATAQVSIGRANLAAAEARLQKLSINAPFKGTVGLRSVSVGTIVQPGQAIASLTSVDPIKVDFGVPELFLQSVRVGQPLEIRIDAAPGRSFRGEVYAIDPVVEAASRAIRLRARVPNPEGALKPGLFARVTLTTGVREDAVLVPEAALVASPTGESSAVYLVRDNRAVLATIGIGRRNGGKVEVTEGVSAGDVVVTAGQTALRDGAAVAVAAPPQSSAAAPNTLTRAQP